MPQLIVSQGIQLFLCREHTSWPHELAHELAAFDPPGVSRQAGIDPKLVADQLGHGLGVNLDVYTVAALDKRQDAVEVLESALERHSSA